MLDSLEEFGIGKGIIGVIITLIVLFVIAMFALGTCSKYIHPWEIGVKQISWSWGNSDSKGYHEGYPGGKRYFYMPMRDTIHVVPTHPNFIDILCEFTPDGKIVTGTGVDVPTTDGSTVVSDITIVWMAFPRASEPGDKIQHGGPLQLFGKYGTNPEYWETLLRGDGENCSKKALGSLETDDYYNSPLRQEKVNLSTKMLNDGWTDEKGVHEGYHKNGIHVIAVLDRAYYYTPEIDNGIFNKNIQVQNALLNKAKELAAAYTAEVTKAEAEGNAAIKTKQVEGQSKVKVILSEVDLYEKTKVSDGDRLVEVTKAEVTKMEADALEKGGGLYISRKLASLVTMIKGGILTDPSQLDQLLSIFIAGKNKKEVAK